MRLEKMMMCDQIVNYACLPQDTKIQSKNNMNIPCEEEIYNMMMMMMMMMRIVRMARPTTIKSAITIIIDDNDDNGKKVDGNYFSNQERLPNIQQSY